MYRKYSRDKILHIDVCYARKDRKRSIDQKTKLEALAWESHCTLVLIGDLQCRQLSLEAAHDVGIGLSFDLLRPGSLLAY